MFFFIIIFLIYILCLNTFYSFNHIIKEVKYEERFNLHFTLLMLFYDRFPLR